MQPVDEHHVHLHLTLLRLVQNAALDAPLRRAVLDGRLLGRLLVPDGAQGQRERDAPLDGGERARDAVGEEGQDGGEELTADVVHDGLLVADAGVVDVDDGREDGSGDEGDRNPKAPANARRGLIGGGIEGGARVGGKCLRVG